MKTIQFTKTSLKDMEKDDVLLVVNVKKMPKSYHEVIDGTEHFLSFVKIDEALDFYRNFDYTNYNYMIYPHIAAKADLDRVYPQFRELFAWI